jgi:hypothetical protein
MSALSAFLESKKLKSESIFWASARIESRGEEDHKLAQARAERKAKKDPAAAPVAKPKSGRGFTRKQLADALAGKALPKRARAKVLRSINALLEKTQQPAATMKDVFGEDAIKAGESKGPAKKKE